MNKRPHRIPAHNQGFTLAEILVSVAVSVTLGAIVFTIVAGTMYVSAKTESRAAVQAVNSSILDDFTDIVDFTDTVVSSTRSVLVVDTREATQCHRNEFRFSPDPVNPGKLQLTFTRVSMGVPVVAPCSLIRDTLNSGSGAFSFGYTIPNLLASSTFEYFDLAGQRTYRPGESNYSPSTGVHQCFLGRVSLHLDRELNVKDDISKIEDSATAHFRGNTRTTGDCL